MSSRSVSTELGICRLISSTTDLDRPAERGARAEPAADALCQRREEASPSPHQYSTELQARKVGGCDSDISAFKLAPQGLASSSCESRVHVRQRIEVRFLQLQRALHGIPEQNGSRLT